MYLHCLKVGIINLLDLQFTTLCSLHGLLHNCKTRIPEVINNCDIKVNDKHRDESCGKGGK